MHLRTILVIVLVVSAVGTVAAQGESMYTPPDDRSLDDLVDAYNANADQTPGWLGAVVDADVVYVTVYPESAAMPSDLFAVETAASGPTIYRFEMRADGRIDDYAGADSVERGEGTYVVAADRSTMDAILTADDPVSVGTAAFTDGSLRLQANGTVQNVMVRMLRFASQVRGLLG